MLRQADDLIWREISSGPASFWDRFPYLFEAISKSRVVCFRVDLAFTASAAGSPSVCGSPPCFDLCWCF